MLNINVWPLQEKSFYEYQWFRNLSKDYIIFTVSKEVMAWNQVCQLFWVGLKTENSIKYLTAIIHNDTKFLSKRAVNHSVCTSSGFFDLNIAPVNEKNPVYFKQCVVFPNVDQVASQI